MTIKYLVAKHIDDPFRNETRNVGVILTRGAEVYARFVGEREDGVFDARKLGTRFRFAGAYTQWREYWRDLIHERNLDEAISTKSANYFVEAGGELTDEGSDSLTTVCDFLYKLVVSDGGANAAFDQSEEEATGSDLSADIRDALKSFNILADGRDLIIRHPVEQDALVTGQKVQHKPSFSQRNGRLSIFEYLDLSSPRYNKTKERAGWMAYMFSDVHDADPNADSFSIVRPEDTGGEAIEYAKTLIAKESRVVNWSDSNERSRFLHERQLVADQV